MGEEMGIGQVAGGKQVHHEIFGSMYKNKEKLQTDMHFKINVYI